MDIHRCRFSEWMPSAACAMTFHPELPLLVVGRENGDIEIWNTEEKWFCESVCIHLLLIFYREFQVMKTCLFDHFSGLSAFLLPIIPCFAIVYSEQVFRDKSLKWISKKCVLLVAVIVMESLCGWQTVIRITTLLLVLVKMDRFVCSISLERM